MSATEVRAPLFISSRLMAALRLEDGSQIHLSASHRDSDGRVVYEWIIDDPDGRTVATGTDLRSGCYAEVNYTDTMGSLLSFLGACAESLAYGPEGENADLFPVSAHAWITDHAEELDYLAYELGEDEDR